jgi:hypothetical protein
LWHKELVNTHVKLRGIKKGRKGQVDEEKSCKIQEKIKKLMSK